MLPSTEAGVKVVLNNVPEFRVVYEGLLNPNLKPHPMPENYELYKHDLAQRFRDQTQAPVQLLPINEPTWKIGAEFKAQDKDLAFVLEAAKAVSIESSLSVVKWINNSVKGRTRAARRILETLDPNYRY
jgi:hypothetical protein